MCECKNLSLWLGIIFGWKGLLLILGILLAYETRNTKMSKSEDIRTTSMAVYNVVILALITGPVSIMIRNQQNAHFAFVSISILVCCSLSIGLIFVPKIIRHRKGIRDQDNIFMFDLETVEESQDEETVRHRIKAENEELKFKISKIEKEIEQIEEQIRTQNHIDNDGKTTAPHKKRISISNNIECNNQEAYMRKHVSLRTNEVKGKHRKVNTLSTQVMPEATSDIEDEKHFEKDMSTCMDNTSGIYSEVMAVTSLGCVTKY